METEPLIEVSMCQFSGAPLLKSTTVAESLIEVSMCQFSGAPLLKLTTVAQGIFMPNLVLLSTR